MNLDASRLRYLARAERGAAEGWLDDSKVEYHLVHNVDYHRLHIREALRLEVLALHCEGQLSALLCGTAVLMVESWMGDDVDELIDTARAVLRP